MYPAPVTMKLILILQLCIPALLVSSSQADESRKLDISIHEEEETTLQLASVLFNNSVRECQALENIATKIGSLEVQEEELIKLNERITKVEEVLSAQTAQQGGCRCKFPFIHLHEACYYFERKGDPRDWYAARATCQMLTADLMSLETEEEAKAIKEFILDFLHPKGDRERSYWIGATDMINEGEFLWVNGNPVTYSDFSEGQPDDLHNEDCIELRFPYNFQWNDFACDGKNYFICERPCL